MNQEPTYHIDTTPEEDQLFQDVPTTKSEFPKKGVFAKVFCIVLSLHLVAAGIIALSTTCSSANAASEKSQNLPSVAETTNTATLNAATSNETTPKTDVPEPTQPPTPVNMPVALKKEQTNSKSPSASYTKKYVVKQGDSIYSISKKYKLSVDRLIKLNNIKDVNKIQIGQTLKFM